MCPSEKLVETDGTFLTLLETMITEMAHLYSVERYAAAAIKNSVAFDCFRSILVHFTSNEH